MELTRRRGVCPATSQGTWGKVLEVAGFVVLNEPRSGPTRHLLVPGRDPEPSRRVLHLCRLL